MNIELFYRLASQLDKETFMEVYHRLEPAEDNRNLLERLDEFRLTCGLSSEDFLAGYGVSRQAYFGWRKIGKLPDIHIPLVSKQLGITEKKASELNFRKNLEPLKVTDILGEQNTVGTVLETERMRLNMTKSEFAEHLGVVKETYANWKKEGFQHRKLSQ